MKLFPLLTISSLLVSGSPFFATEKVDEAKVIELVREKNLSLIIEKFNVDIAKAERVQAALWANPSLGLSSTLNPFHKEYEQTTSAGPRQLDLALAIPIDANGKRSLRKKSADIAIRLAEALYVNKTRMVIRDSRLAYVQALYLRDKLNLVQQKKNAMQSLVRILERRIGTASGGRQPLLLDRTRLAVENTLVEERLVDTQYAAILVELRILCGYSGQDNLAPTGILRIKNSPLTDSLPQLIEKARANRPDLRAALLAITFSKEQKDLALAEKWDDIEFSLGLTRQLGFAANPNDVDALGNVQTKSLPGEYSFGFGVRIALPIIDRKQGNVEKTEQQIKQSEFASRALEREIENEVIKAYNKIVATRASLSEYEKTSLKRAQRVKDAQQRLFGTGGVNLLEYFDSYGAYFDTISGYYETASEFRKACIELETAIAAALEGEATVKEANDASR
ncbi:MAG TPA: TolC family protein [Turneriella sp.]|nr:TolC family protein [Turneriella sp.]